MDLSIVTSLYQSALEVAEFHRRVSQAAERVTDDYELILVNDGSQDNSLQEARRLVDQDHRVRVVDLARNYGQTKALMTGMAHARGREIFLIDSDLEEEPELLETFHRELHDGGVDVVYGVQEDRRGGWFERFSGWLFFHIFNLLSDQPVPVDLVLLRLMTARYVSALLQHQEREVALSGLFALTGFDQRALPVAKRTTSRTSYSFARKLADAVRALTAFSNRPLVYIFYLGSAITLLSGAAGLYLLTLSLVFEVRLPGLTSVTIAICFSCGLMIFCQGLIGLYLARIFTETKRRPYTIIRAIYENMSKSAPSVERTET